MLIYNPQPAARQTKKRTAQKSFPSKLGTLEGLLVISTFVVLNVETPLAVELESLDTTVLVRFTRPFGGVDSFVTNVIIGPAIRL